MLLGCFFASGASSLVYEIIWLRWLGQIFSATTLAVSTVLTAFMAGLAAGSWAAGRVAPRLERRFEPMPSSS
jgi:spermidine synthase